MNVKKLLRLIFPVILLLCLLLSACSSLTKKTGTAKGLVMESTSREMFAQIKLDDGTEIVAFPKVFSTPEGGGTQWKLVDKGQRVEVEPIEEANAKNSSAKWKIVRVLETGK